MKIFSASQIKAIDQFTIENEPIQSVDLMERASASFANWFCEKFHQPCKIVVFCGSGNNGGDGLAVARMLLERGKQVSVFVINFTSLTDDFSANLKRLKGSGKVSIIEKEEDIPELEKGSIVIDALFGSGLTRRIEGLPALVIDKINSAEATVVAIDVPSGLYTDRYTHPENAVVRADYTYTFQFPKLSFLFPSQEQFIGEWTVGDIGLHQEIINSTNTPFYYIEKGDICKILKPRTKFSHKGTFGHALMVGGSYGKIGAIRLAAEACLRTGTGLVTVYLPKCGYHIIQTALPEAMAITDPRKNMITESPAIGTYNAVGVGPGMGKAGKTLAAFTELISRSIAPFVLDADALNLLSENPDLIKKLPALSILTPHPKEFERLAGKSDNAFEQLEKLQNFSGDYNVIVVLKGAHTAIATPDRKVFFNSTGNVGMATGGSGDVLTGIITSLLAQGYAPEDAAVFGVYLHGLAGDFAAEEKGYEAMTASDIIAHLGTAYCYLRASKI